MKELSNDEKAKAYDNVVDKLRRFMAQGVNPLITRADVQDFFPELKESEDEEIRETLVKFFTDWGKTKSHCWGVPVSKILAWLDEQRMEAIEMAVKALQEEPVSEFLNTESMIESYKQRLISQANGVKNSPLIDMCLASYKHGINETLDTLNLSNAQRTVKNWKEPVSEELEEAIDNYIKRNGYDGLDSIEEVKYIAQYFTKWQKKQMMTKAVDGKVIANGMGNPILHLWDKGRHLIGKKVKVIVIRED